MWELIKKTFNLLFAYKQESCDGKKPWKSKTIWVNVFAIMSVICAKYLDIHFTNEDVGVFLSMVNIVLRLVSRSPIGFYKEDTVPVIELK